MARALPLAESLFISTPTQESIAVHSQLTQRETRWNFAAQMCPHI